MSKIKFYCIFFFIGEENGGERGEKEAVCPKDEKQRAGGSIDDLGRGEVREGGVLKCGMRGGEGLQGEEASRSA